MQGVQTLFQVILEFILKKRAKRVIFFVWREYLTCAKLWESSLLKYIKTDYSFFLFLFWWLTVLCPCYF